MLKNNLLVILLSTSVLVPNTYAQQAACPIEQCDRALESCQKTIEAKNKEIQLCRLALVQSIDRAEGLSLELEHKNNQLQSVFRNPLAMTTFGILIGIVVTGLATK